MRELGITDMILARVVGFGNGVCTGVNPVTLYLHKAYLEGGKAREAVVGAGEVTQSVNCES